MRVFRLNEMFPAWIVVLALLLISGCHERSATPPAAGDQPRRGGTAVLGSISDVDSWNEYLSRQNLAHNLLRRIYLRLAGEPGDRPDRAENWEPLLAESWQFSDDRLALTFVLRDAVWSDGERITAGDVRFTWLAQTSEDVPWAGVSTKSHIRDVEVVDDRTATFHFDAVYPHQFVDAVEGGILPQHVFGAVPFERWQTHDWSTASAASGPFVLARHEPGHEVVLAANPRYYEPSLPRLDQVVVRIVPDIENLMTQLRTGDVDYVEGITPRDADRLAQDGRLSVLVFDYPKYDFIGWNGSRPPFDDPELRRAITMAIDRDSLVVDLMYGYGRVGSGPIPSFRLGANTELQPWPYDPEAARERLADLGYAAVGPDGVASASGRPLSFELLTNSGNRLREDMLVKIQAQLAEVGIHVDIRPMEMRAMRQKVGSGDFDGFLGGWAFAGKVDLRPLFDSELVPPRGMNIVHYRSPVVDRLFDKVEDAGTWDELKPHLDAIQLRIHRDQPYTFLYEVKRVAAHGPRLRGVQIDVPSDPLARLERYWVD
jgi:peptide/nickel transport system substrate-binding protein